MKWTPWTPGINFHPTSLEFVVDDYAVEDVGPVITEETYIREVKK